MSAERSAAPGQAVTLEQLAVALAIDPSVGATNRDTTVQNAVASVRSAHTFAELEGAEAGDVVLIAPGLQPGVPSYRFDLALGRMADGVAAIVGGDPSPTGRRVAARRGVALAQLRPGYDVASLAVLVRDLTSSDQQIELAGLELACRAADNCDDASQIEELLADVSASMGCRLALLRAKSSSNDLPIRVQGVVRKYLSVDVNADSSDRTLTPLMEIGRSHIARRIEALLQAEFDANELPDTTRSELINEILLNDPSTSADSVRRLREADFPVDGSHCAIRIDCHDPSTLLDGDIAVFRAQQRIAAATYEAVRETGGSWARAGTAHSVILVSSRPTPHGQLVAPEVSTAAERALEAADAIIDGLRIHVGIGGQHLGVAGLRTTVNEAATAVRSAREAGHPNQPHHFDRLGLSRSILQWAEIDGVRPVVYDVLAPLLAQKPRQAGESLATLRAYLDNGRNIAATAEQLHLHRNTVRYRVDRLRKQLSVDLDNPDDRLLVELGCRLVTSERDV